MVRWFRTIKSKNKKSTVLYWFLAVACDLTVDGTIQFYTIRISIRKSLLIGYMVTVKTQAQSMGFLTIGPDR